MSFIYYLYKNKGLPTGGNEKIKIKPSKRLNKFFNIIEY